MIPEIVSGAQALTTTFKLARDLQELVNDTDAALKVNELVGKIGETQGHWMASQAQVQALLDENRSLKDQIAEAEGWNDRAAQYELHDLGKHNFVMLFKGSPQHHACKICFEREKQIMTLNSFESYTGVMTYTVRRQQP